MGNKIASAGAMLVVLALALTFVAIPALKNENARAIKATQSIAKNGRPINVGQSSLPEKPYIEEKKEGPVSEPKRRPTWNRTAINVLKEHPECNLSRDEILAVQKVYAHLSDARAESELKLAKVTVLSPTQTMLEIPAYPSAGAEMLAEFHDEIKAALIHSQANAEEVYNILSPNFVSQNNNLGEYPQKLVISQTSPDHYEVMREISVPNVGVARSTSTITGTSPLHYAGLESTFPGRNSK